MNNTQIKRLEVLEAKETNRKQRVKEYFIRRNTKNAFYQTFFDKNANEADRKTLQDTINAL